MNKHTLFIFRRDLRLVDNTALVAAFKKGPVTAAYVFDEKKLHGKKANLFQLRFICQSLVELSERIAALGGVLNIFVGDPHTIITSLVQSKSVAGVVVNADFTPDSIAFDAYATAVCTRAGIAYEVHNDALLTNPGSVLTGSGVMFKMFTPFYRAACDRVAVEKPVKRMPAGEFSSHLLAGAHRTVPHDVANVYASLQEGTFSGGRSAGLKALQHACTLSTYVKRRDVPADEAGTSHLSPHMALGTVSVREVYHTLCDELGMGAAAPLIRSLYWRDFFTQLAVDQPRVYGEPFQKAYAGIEWENDAKKFARWKEGKTGFPIVDAGMRQLNETGYMHNRVRMVVASFLIKDLHIDWQWGEAYFAEKLVDYDPAVNNGNWQWCASTGCDSQPYFRIFNPWLQQKKFDPDAVYCKRWLPELAKATAAQIHAGFKKRIVGYYQPLVEHAVESRKAIAVYKHAAKGVSI